VEYDGTLLLVSHDRAFLDEVVTGTLVFEGDGRVAEYTGGYEDWVRQRPAAAANGAPVRETGKAAAPPPKGGRPRKMLNRDQRELEELPGQIEKLESEREALARKLEDPALYQNGPAAARALQAQLDALEKTLQTRFARWEELEALRASLPSP
jgi:ATP-binding cassette subfamily F protein uup